MGPTNLLNKTRRDTPVVHRDRTLDRQIHFDSRSANFPVRAVLRDTAKPRSYTWAHPFPDVLDQGHEGACVGFGIANEARHKPKVWPTTTQDALDLYRRAQAIDEWPGEAYSGTSVLAGMKAAKEAGWIEEYRWAFGVEDVALAVSRLGPVVLGIPWHDSMYETHPIGDGRHEVRVTGDPIGGHCILAVGYSVKTRRFKLHNSWGDAWGNKGRAEIQDTVLGTLLGNGGESCVPLVRGAK